MKKVILYLHNYGTITKIANFGNAGHDANICLKAMNDNQIKGHGYLPKTIFYFLQWQGKHGKHISVDYTGYNLRDTSHASIIRELQYKELIAI